MKFGSLLSWDNVFLLIVCVIKRAVLNVTSNGKSTAGVNNTVVIIFAWGIEGNFSTLCPSEVGLLA